MSKIQEILAENTVDLKKIRSQYEALCNHRDSVNEQLAPIQAELDILNEAAEKARQACFAKAAEIQKIRGGEDWILLKREIGRLAGILQVSKK